MRTPEKDIIELTLLNTKMRIRTSEDKNHLSNVVKEYKEMLDTVEKKRKNPFRRFDERLLTLGQVGCLFSISVVPSANIG